MACPGPHSVLIQAILPVGMIGHVSSRLRLLSINLARHWLQTLIVSVLAVFAASYFYFMSVHALESFDAGSCTPLAAGDSGKCASSLQALLDDNRPYPGITVDGYFGVQTCRGQLRSHGNPADAGAWLTAAEQRSSTDTS
jgi:hypothetical protein